MSAYGYPSCSNGCSSGTTYEYWQDFADGATISAGGYYLICHGSADDEIQAFCDETYSYLSNGDDVMTLVYGDESSFTVVDTIGDAWSSTDPGSSWTVCGDDSATQDNTLVRTKCANNGGVWSGEEDASTCTWDIYDQDEAWDMLNTFTCSCADCTSAPTPVPVPSSSPTLPPAVLSSSPTTTTTPSSHVDTSLSTTLAFGHRRVASFE